MHAYDHCTLLKYTAMTKAEACLHDPSMPDILERRFVLSFLESICGIAKCVCAVFECFAGSRSSPSQHPVGNQVAVNTLHGTHMVAAQQGCAVNPGRLAPPTNINFEHSYSHSHSRPRLRSRSSQQAAVTNQGTAATVMPAQSTNPPVFFVPHDQRMSQHLRLTTINGVRTIPGFKKEELVPVVLA